MTNSASDSLLPVALKEQMDESMRLLLCAALVFAPAVAGQKARLVLREYGVLFDPQSQGYRANAATAAMLDRQLYLVFTGAIEDDEAGTLPFLVRSMDVGKSWTKPERFGAEILNGLVKSPADEFVSLALFGPTKEQTLISVGYHVARGVRKETYREDVRWRPSAALIGRRPKGGATYAYREYPSGTFLGEQFAAGGIICRSGRVMLQIWGARRREENWQAGVLISDDDARTWRYRQTAYEPDPAIRDDPKMPAGFNEQTLFETKEGRIVSIIRGREKLGRLRESPKDTWYFRVVSDDRGETWSHPERTNLAGTGAPATGLTLPDGSFLNVSRLPYSRTLYPLPEKDLFGLHVVRSFDSGRTWQTEWIKQRDPDGKPFDNYYNAMNGQFLQTGPREWIYLFGQFSVKTNVHRILMLRFALEPDFSQL